MTRPPGHEGERDLEREILHEYSTQRGDGESRVVVPGAQIQDSPDWFSRSEDEPPEIPVVGDDHTLFSQGQPYQFQVGEKAQQLRYEI